MPEFFATTSKGLGVALEQELTELGLAKVRRLANAVYFEGNWESCYRTNLHSRIASRVLKPVFDFTAYNLDELFGQVLKHDFTKHIDMPFSLKVEASVEESKIHDQRMLALKVKDAICDQFREAGGARPDVDKLQPDLRVYIRGQKNQFSIAIDTTGESLYRRGYREDAGVAPLRENLAAGILRLMQWKPGTQLLDPMCGSGTFLIEAAQIQFRIAPGSYRRRFGFQRLKNYQKEIWARLVEEALAQEIPPEPGLFWGFDADPRIIKLARANADRAGVGPAISFQKALIATLQKPPGFGTGVLVSNPPYGLRLGDVHELHDVYKDLGYTLKKEFAGSEAWILAGEKDLTPDLRLKSDRRFSVHNGSVDCRLLHYPLKAFG
ncbi:MAG: THUMP domain-containing protein [Bdellovibrio sp.]